MTQLELTVPCTPVAQPRVRARIAKTRKGKAFVHMYTPAKADGFKDALILAMRAHKEFPAAPWEGPIGFTCEIFFERPDRLNRKCDPTGAIRHTSKPDWDNVAKAICDAGTTAGLWKDDAQLCRAVIDKWYVAKGHRAGVWITIERLQES